jgi:ADP-ribose pyrophosphatase YjhB (NUDIX family)
MGFKTEINRTWTCDGCGISHTAKIHFFSPEEAEANSIYLDEHKLTKLPMGEDRSWEIITLGNHRSDEGYEKVQTALLCPECVEVISHSKTGAGDGFSGLIAAYARVFQSRPIVTVDAIVTKVIGFTSKFLLIKRKNPPHGWALPGGLVDYGETVETAVVRELREETGLEATIDDLEFFHVSSDRQRDPRFHSVSLAYEILDFKGEAKAADDAKECGWFTYDEIKNLEMAFDHREIITKFWKQLLDAAEKSI